MPKLTVYTPDGTSVKYGLNGKSFTVGRADSNDIVLPGGSASNHHAVLKLSDSGDFVVTDFDSTNHTLVNGEVVQSRGLRDGDEVHFGDIMAIYSSEVSGQSTPHRAAPKFDPEPEEAPVMRSAPEPAPPVNVVRPGVKRPGPGAAGGLAPAASAQGESGGCFALLLLFLVAGGAFTLGLMLRHNKDHQGQSLPEYVAQWRLDKAKAEAAAAKGP